MLRPEIWQQLFLVLAFVCLGASCGGGGGSNGGGGSSPNPVPTLGSLSPNSGIAGAAAITLTASGSNFVPSSVLEWNGAALSTSYVSTSSLTALLPVSNLVVAGTANVDVRNPTPGGGTSGAVTFTVANPVPTITSISPSSAGAGAASFTLNVAGDLFVSNSQVLWNNTQVPTTYTSSTSLTAQIPATDLGTPGTATVAVQNPAPGGGTSSILAFAINAVRTSLNVLNLEGTDLVWNPIQQKVYVAVPAAATNNASTITTVDPISGTVVATQSLSSPASGLAISDDNQYLYAVTNGGVTIQRFTLPALGPDIQWSLGTDPISGATNLAGDIKVQPGSSHTLAVSLGSAGSGSIAVFDNSVQRSAVAANTSLGNSLQWNQDGTALYAAYTIGNDSPLYSTVSDDALFTMPVDTTGVGNVTTYHRSFRQESVHLHSDPATGYVYGDWGEVVNAANGIPVGNFRWSRPSGTYFPGPLSVVDPNLKRLYTLLEVNEPDGTQAFQIQSFDQTQFQLLSTMVISNAQGQPTNFIRWGQSGLAFVTNDTSSSAAGKLYILDGAFVNSTSVPDTLAGAQLNPVPTLTAISPLMTFAGSPEGIALTISGRDFIGQPTVCWNGNALSTTMVNSTQLSAQVPASDLTTVGQATITVSNNGGTFPSSNAMPFAIDAVPPSGTQLSVYGTAGNDLLWDATRARLYLSVPGVQGDSGDTVAIVDPAAGTVTNTGFIGSEPARLSLSNDGQYLYLALYGQNAIQQLTLPNFGINSIWSLGGAGSFDGPYYALDLQASPGSAQTTAVTLANFDLSPSSAAVVIYDGSTPRPTPLQVTAYSYSGLKWAGDSTLYAVDQTVPQDFLVLGVGSSGAALSQHYNGVLTGFSQGIHFDPGTGLVYTDAGQAIQPTTGTIVGSYGSSGLLVSDSTLDRVFILGQTSAQIGTTNYTLASFDQTNFTAVASMVINNVVGAPTAFVRWGVNGLAFTTRVGQPSDFRGTGPGQLYVISGNFVSP